MHKDLKRRKRIKRVGKVRRVRRVKRRKSILRLRIEEILYDKLRIDRIDFDKLNEITQVLYEIAFCMILYDRIASFSKAEFPTNFTIL